MNEEKNYLENEIVEKTLTTEEYFLKNKKHITIEEMIQYIESEAPDKKKEIAEASLDDTKRFNFMKFKSAFYNTFFPDTVKPPKPSEIITSWLNIE